jgi:MFS transporter, DHA1 family, inner membrane transport protein
VAEDAERGASATAGGGPARAAGAPVGLILFTAMFASQAALLVLTPVLAAVATDFGVSTSTTAQLRSISGIVAGGVALWMGWRSRPRPLRDVLGAGLALLVASSATSAAAPGFAVLAAAQVGIGVGLGLVLSAALAAAGQWAPQAQARTLSWALVGQPAAWIVGMPLAGAVAERSWRFAWVAVPLASSLVALVALATRPRDTAAVVAADEPTLWEHAGARGWAVGELLAYGGWAGTLVFVGALLVDSYGTSTTVVGLLLAGAAVAYVPGNFLARRIVDRRARSLLRHGGVVSGVGVAVLGALRPGVLFSGVLFAALAFVAGGRTLAGSSLGLRLAPSCRLQSMSVRTAATQYGYLLGAVVGGAALALGGYRMLGAALGGLYVLAAVPHLREERADRRRGRPGDALTAPPA